LQIFRFLVIRQNGIAAMSRPSTSPQSFQNRGKPMRFPIASIHTPFNIFFRNSLVPSKTVAVVLAFCLLLVPRLWADSRKEYIYLDEKLIAVETDAVTATCSYSISTTGASVVMAGGTGTVTVNSAAGCPWTASRNASWITVTGGSSGSGSGTVSYSVASNTGSARSGTLTIAGKTFTVSQAGTTCQQQCSTAAQSCFSQVWLCPTQCEQAIVAQYPVCQIAPYACMAMLDSCVSNCAQSAEATCNYQNQQCLAKCK
jgi:hypothetical protein